MKIFTYIFWSFYKISSEKQKNEVGAYIFILYVYAIIIFFVMYFNDVNLIARIGDKFARNMEGFVIVSIIAIPIYLLFPYKKIKNLQYTPEQKYLYNKILLFGGAALFLSICFGFIWDVIDWIKWVFRYVKEVIISFMK